METRLTSERMMKNAASHSCLPILLIALFHGGLVRAASPDQKALCWDKQEGKHLALLDQAGVIWQFNFGSELMKPYFHPVSLPGSDPLTANRPGDHSWHHGLWFSWVKINGVNYWEHVRKAGRPAGQTRWRDTQVTCRDDYSAEFKMQLEYGPHAGETVLWEERRIVVSAVDSTGQYQIDWSSTFSSRERAVTLSCTPVPTAAGGKFYGGYAGLGVRFAERFSDRQVHSAEGKAEFDSKDRYRTRSAACDYSGDIAGRDAGIAILSDPENPRSPSNWYAIRSHMSFLNPSFLASGPYIIPAKGQLRVRYRVIVHPGQWGTDRVAQAAAAYLHDLEAEHSKVERGNGSRQY